MIFRVRSLIIVIVVEITLGGRKIWFWDVFQQKVERHDKAIENKANWTTEEWIRNSDYPCDICEVITEDGYILSLHRIPKPGHQPVLLVHGFLTSSLSFVMLGKENSLAFQFASSNFDTWLVNTRGTVQSRKHTSIPIDDPRFWKFSFHEVGLFDIAATIDFIRNSTGFHEVIYTGHSQGATALFALCSTRPEYNERILLMHALAPVVYLRDFVQISMETLNTVKRFLKKKIRSQSFEVFMQGDPLRKCSSKSKKPADCLQFMNDILGSGHYNRTLDPVVLGTAIAGGSIQEIQHYLQILESGDFVAYDYGLDGNHRTYTHPEPDGYNLSLITIPTILHYGRTDAIATPAAIHKLYKALPNTIGLHAVPTSRFNHFDFVWSPTLRSLLNANIVRLCEEFLEGVLKYRVE